MLALGDRDRCKRCGRGIVLVKNPHIISISSAVWVHLGLLGRFATHHAEGPMS